MTIHDIIRFPKRVSEVLDDLHAAVEVVRDYAAVVAEKQYRDCQTITRGYSDRIGELTSRIAELESELAKFKADEDSLIGDLQHVVNENASLTADVKKLESQLNARDDQPLPWRPIGEFEVRNGYAVFHNGVGCWTSKQGGPTGATHFLYLNVPEPAVRLAWWQSNA